MNKLAVVVALILPSSVLLATSLLVTGCDDEEGDAAEESVGPIVGVMELPISLRNSDSAPSNAISIEVSPTELRVDGHKVLDLTGGAVPPDARQGEVLPAVQQAVGAGAARRAAVLDVHVSTPYETTALIIGSLKAANIHALAFKVRKPGGVGDVGYLVVENYLVQAFSNDATELEGPTQRNWDDLVAVWQEAYEGCRRDHYVDCSFKPNVVAEGGKLELRFFARGSALKIEFQRFGAEDIDAEANAAGPALLDGIAPAQAFDEEGPEPATAGAFTWRFDAAVDELSPISAAMRPLCGPNPCGIGVTGDKETMTMRLVSLIGAAFPDGTQAPQLVFHVPAP